MYYCFPINRVQVKSVQSRRKHLHKMIRQSKNEEYVNHMLVLVRMHFQ